MLVIEIVCVRPSKGLDPTCDINTSSDVSKKKLCACSREMESRSSVVEVNSMKKTYLNTQGKSQIVWISCVTDTVLSFESLVYFDKI